MIVGADDLEDVLDQTLGGFRGLVDHRSVIIDPSSGACSIRMSLTSSVKLQSGALCTLDACTTVVSRGKSLALREFEVAGCDPVFKMFGLSRHVPSTYADAGARIRQQCGSDDFEIDRVSAVSIAGSPKLRIVFRPVDASR